MKPGRELEIVFIGDKFYDQSSTIMSSIYKKDGDKYSRFDWGFVNVALRNGESLRIRPATNDELAMFQAALDGLVSERKQALGAAKGGRE